MADAELVLGLDDLFRMFMSNRMQSVVDEFAEFLNDVGVELVYNESMEGIDFEKIEDYLKEQN